MVAHWRAPRAAFLLGAGGAIAGALMFAAGMLRDWPPFIAPLSFALPMCAALMLAGRLRWAGAAALIVIIAVAFAAGCGGASEQRSEDSKQAAVPAGLGTPRRFEAVKTCTSGSFRPTATQSYAAVVRWAAVVRNHPNASAPVVLRFAVK